MEKRWVDQPDCVEGARVLLHQYVGEAQSVEIRRKDDMYFLSVGNLFGSQTVLCPSSESTFECLDLVSRAALNKQTITVPRSCTLIPNSEQ